MAKFGISFGKLDWDVKTPQMWKTINHGKKTQQQVGNISNNQNDQSRFYDGNAKSWAPDIHKGIEPSTLVKSIDYNGKDLTLTVVYRDGFKATYHNIDEDMAKEFSNADSKGRWALANLWGRAYS